MNISRRGLVAAALGSLLLASCATITLAPAGIYKADKAFNVTLARPWADFSRTGTLPEGVHLLTVDGLLLNRLYLAMIAPAGSLVRPADKDTPVPVYRSDMGDTEMAEFVIDSLAAFGYLEPQSNGLRPQTFAGQPGVRFEISTRNEDGLNISGTALVARAGDNLNMMLFLAPSEHYYGAYAAEIDAIFASATST